MLTHKCIDLIERSITHMHFPIEIAYDFYDSNTNKSDSNRLNKSKKYYWSLLSK